MYAYYRFWDAEKAILLYPGIRGQNKFRSYLTDDYSKDHTNNHYVIDHQCKMSIVEVMKGEELNSELGKEILSMPF